MEVVGSFEMFRDSRVIDALTLSTDRAALVKVRAMVADRQARELLRPTRRG